MSAPRVTAVVLNWCNERDTVECLDSLGRQDYPALQLVLVDNASPDGSGEALHARYPQIPYLQTGANLGYAGGNNRGIERAIESATDYVLVINNDTVADERLVTALVQAAESAMRVGAVGPKILRHDDPRTIWFGGGRFDALRAMGRHERENSPDDAREDAGAREVTFLTGCCLLLPASALLANGAFREEFFAYMEDVELSVRLRAAGLTLLFAPAARLMHKAPPAGAAPSPASIRLRDRNRRRLVALHYRPLARLRFMLWFYPTRVALALRYMLSDDPARARAIARGMFGR